MESPVFETCRWIHNMTKYPTKACAKLLYQLLISVKFNKSERTPRLTYSCIINIHEPRPHPSPICFCFSNNMMLMVQDTDKTVSPIQHLLSSCITLHFSRITTANKTLKESAEWPRLYF